MTRVEFSCCYSCYRHCFCLLFLTHFHFVFLFYNQFIIIYVYHAILLGIFLYGAHFIFIEYSNKRTRSLTLLFIQFKMCSPSFICIKRETKQHLTSPSNSFRSFERIRSFFVCSSVFDAFSILLFEFLISYIHFVVCIILFSFFFFFFLIFFFVILVYLHVMQYHCCNVF